MQECLEACSLRLTTHPELRDAYQEKFGLATYILPAVVPAHLVRTQSNECAWDGRTRSAALLGSFWDQSWFDRLCSALEFCRCSTDWYGQNNSPWLKFPPEALARARIRPFGIVPEDRLAAELNKYPFVIVPAGALDGRDNHTAAASLSLPGRILFAAATAHTPILIVGSERNCGARFVRHYGIGTVAPYEAQALVAAMDHLRDPKVQSQMRRNAAALSASLSDEGAAEWLSASIEQGRPADNRFEEVFSSYYAAGLGHYQCETR
jgi:hypothetical protein